MHCSNCSLKSERCMRSMPSATLRWEVRPLLWRTMRQLQSRWLKTCEATCSMASPWGWHLPKKSRISSQNLKVRSIRRFWRRDRLLKRKVRSWESSSLRGSLLTRSWGWDSSRQRIRSQEMDLLIAIWRHLLGWARRSDSLRSTRFFSWRKFQSRSSKKS